MSDRPLLSFYLSTISAPDDRELFVRLYERCRYPMLHAAVGVLHDRQLAEDAVQNAFLKVLDILPRLRGMGDRQALCLLTVIAKNKAIDLLRREKRFSSLPPDDQMQVLYDAASPAPVEGADKSRPPVELLIEEEGYRRLVGCIGKLSETYRSVFELKYFAELSDQQIADALDLNLKTVQMRLYRGRRVLAEALRKEDAT